MADSNSADSISCIGVEISTLERRFVLFLTDFSLRMRISAIFLLPAQVLVTNSEIRIADSYFRVTMAYGSIMLSFQDMGTRQTNDSIA